MLLLDEPTNNLDLDAIRALGEALKGYEGAIVLACHDVSFVKDTCDVVYHIAKGAINRLEGGADQYQDMVRSSVLRQRAALS